ncbi:MAG TPA: CBS domain-containing protein [Candidatus Nitrosotenuis sp.]|nr:CBS domain-containing protein [Candidatus Nitrosotenuis sp.]
MTTALEQPISNFIDKAFVIQEGNEVISEGVKKMEEFGVDSLLIVNDNEINGIVTHRDILFGAVAKGKDPTKTKLKEIMHTPLVSIQKNAKVKDAISMMNKNNVRRLVVLDNKMPIGLVSQKVLVGNIATHAIVLPELEIPNKFKCPYCSSLFDDKKTLSSHIDNIHIGKGLFEGNLARAEELGTINPPSEFPKTL